MVNIRTGTRVNNFWFGFILLLVCTVVFSGIGIYLLRGNLELIRDGIRTKATVVEMAMHKSSKSTTYKPVVAYTTSSGETIRAEYSSGSSNKNAYRVGQQIGIIYSPGDPNNILIDKFFDKYGFPVIFIIGGIICLLLEINMTFRKIKYGV